MIAPRDLAPGGRATAAPVAQLDPSMCAFIRESGDALEVLHVFGEIDLSNVGEFSGAVEHLASEPHSVAIDLSGCTYVDSSGLRVLGKAYVAGEGRLRIVLPAHGPVRRIFDITGLAAQFDSR